jgi:processive 1,2-diacylglycerol beta-glucosyltransferase
MYLANSGHQAAAEAIEAALHLEDPGVRTLAVDPVEYAHPYFSRLVHHTYMGLIRRMPELWDAMYDSRPLEQLSRRTQWLTHRGRNPRFLSMMDDFAPDAVICTQAYSLGLICEHRRQTGRAFPVFGVVTDFRPHRFWIQDGTVEYVVPTPDAADRLGSLGVARARLRVLGIPIHPAFAVRGGEREPRKGRHRVLVMGGSQGLGVKYRTIRLLDGADTPFVIDVVTGMNERLRREVLRHRDSFRHPLRVRGFSRSVARLMRQADLLVSKPGGLTCAEAMASGLPMLVVRPLPGQEAGNLDVLVRQGAALHLESDRDVRAAVDALLQNPERLAALRRNAARLARPGAARDIAREVLAAAGERPGTDPSRSAGDAARA